FAASKAKRQTIIEFDCHSSTEAPLLACRDKRVKVATTAPESAVVKSSRICNCNARKYIANKDRGVIERRSKKCCLLGKMIRDCDRVESKEKKDPRLARPCYVESRLSRIRGN
ncbi:hypothetical protein G9C98_007491, partial [Cotesia typhae]